MLKALSTNFKGEEELDNMLRYEAPKMGNDDDLADEIAVKLLNWYADSMEGHVNDRGGIYRAGTGSAMYYIWQAQSTQATPDGRQKGEEFACNYSPHLSPDWTDQSPLSSPSPSLIWCVWQTAALLPLS